MNKQEKKEYLAQLNFCRTFLHLGGMLNDQQNQKIHDKIRKYQDRNKVEISTEEISSVKIVYTPPLNVLNKKTEKLKTS